MYGFDPLTPMDILPMDILPLPTNEHVNIDGKKKPYFARDLRSGQHRKEKRAIH